MYVYIHKWICKYTIFDDQAKDVDLNFLLQVAVNKIKYNKIK